MHLIWTVSDSVHMYVVVLVDYCILPWSCLKFFQFHHWLPTHFLGKAKKICETQFLSFSILFLKTTIAIHSKDIFPWVTILYFFNTSFKQIKCYFQHNLILLFIKNFHFCTNSWYLSSIITITLVFFLLFERNRCSFLDFAKRDRRSLFNENKTLASSIAELLSFKLLLAKIMTLWPSKKCLE